jgi:chromosome segregation ATPase
MKTLTRLSSAAVCVVAMLVVPVWFAGAEEPLVSGDAEMQEALAQLDAVLAEAGDAGVESVPPAPLSDPNGMEAEIEQLQAALSVRDKALQASAEVLEEAEARMKNAQDENQILKNELELQRRRGDELEAARRQAQADFDRMFKQEAETASPDVEAARQTAEIARLTGELAAAQAALERAPARDQAPVASDADGARIRELEAAIAEMKDVDAQRKAALDDLFKQLAVQKNVIGARDQSLAETRAALEAEKTRVVERTRELAARDEVIAARQKELSGRQDELAALEVTLAEARRQAESAAATVAVHETELSALSGEIEQIKLVDAQRRKTLDDTLASLATAEQGVKTLSAELGEARAQHTASAEAMAAKLSELSSRNALLEGEITRMERDVKTAEAEQAAALANVSNLQNTLAVREASVVDLEAQVARLAAVDTQRRKAMDQILLDTATLEQDKARLERLLKEAREAATVAAVPAIGNDVMEALAPVEQAGWLQDKQRLEAQLNALRATAAQDTERLASVTRELTQAQQNAVELTTRVRELESRKPDVRDSDLFKELEQINTILREKMLEVEADRQRLAKLAEGAGKMEAEHARTIATHTARLAEMDAALTEAKEREDEYKELIERLVPKVETLEKQVTELAQERQDLANRLLLRDEDLQALKVELERREHRLAKAERVADVLEKARTEVLRAGDREKLNMHYNMASVYAREGKFTEAENEYLQALRIDPTDADVHYNLGILYDDEMKQSEKAMVHYRRYLQLNPHGLDADRVRTWLRKLEMQAPR